MKIKKITSAGMEPVYNMTVANHHNFLIDGGIILKNCDALRYFIAGRPRPALKNIEKKLSVLPFALKTEDANAEDIFMEW